MFCFPDPMCSCSKCCFCQARLLCIQRSVASSGKCSKVPVGSFPWPMLGSRIMHLHRRTLQEWHLPVSGFPENPRVQLWASRKAWCLPVHGLLWHPNMSTESHWHSTPANFCIILSVMDKMDLCPGGVASFWCLI